MLIHLINFFFFFFWPASASMLKRGGTWPRSFLYVSMQYTCLVSYDKSLCIVQMMRPFCTAAQLYNQQPPPTAFLSWWQLAKVIFFNGKFKKNPFILFLQHNIIFFSGGKHDRHFMVDACPVFHNSNRKAQRDFRQEINKKSTARKKALSALAAKSPLQTQTNEQRKHLKQVRKHFSS